MSIMTGMDFKARAIRGRNETRSFTATDMEMRAGDDGAIRFTGIASVVDTPYTVRDMFGEFSETIMPGAFNRTIAQKADIRLLKNHDSNFVFARTKSGTMTVAADPHLRVDAPSLDPSNPQVQTLRSELSRGDVDQMSIGMIVRDDEWNKDFTERRVKEIELPETSIVTFPASPTTSAALRSIDELLSSVAGLDMSEADLRRAIEAFNELLPDETPPEPGTGVFVTDEMIAHLSRRPGLNT